MKNVVSLMAGLVLLVGCSREQQKPEANPPTAKPAPVAMAKPVASPAVVPTPAPKAITAVAQPAVPPVGATVSKPAPVTEPTSQPPTSRSIYLEAIPAGMLNPESAAAAALAKAQELFLQGQTNAAAEVLTAAMADPACQPDRPVVARKLITLLLASGLTADAQAAYIASATDEKSALFNLDILNRTLVVEQNNRAAAAEWAARLEALPLTGPAADLNLGNLVSSLWLAGATDEAAARVPVIMERPDEAQNVTVLRKVGGDIIKNADAESAERFLAAIEKSSQGKAAYADLVSSLRKFMGRVEAERSGAGVR